MEESSKGYQICGAIKKDGLPCLRPAGWGTHHSGAGVCKLHGGAAPQAYTRALRLNIKHFSTDVAKRTKELFHDPELMDLTKEIATARALLEQAELSGNDDLPFQNMLLLTIGRLVHTKHKIEFERSGYIKIEFARDLMEAWMKAASEFIPDMAIRKQLFNRVEASMRGKVPMLARAQPEDQNP